MPGTLEVDPNVSTQEPRRTPVRKELTRERGFVPGCQGMALTRRYQTRQSIVKEVPAVSSLLQGSNSKPFLIYVSET